nr:MAG TPA: hypothetical protein [Caudoviricetes sp.]DAK71358.1 MAG TPA: hypothetical protein [Caudoviricetes sp.]DAP68994.1 MAG TPA: hypothetical protein [Caudoviricetes sp.]DAW32143.1 MAG TPA: hypothetical protein [Caudoviricetes sp.]DAZ38248.1 MAG TPA: hypothetical protein [Caudoviricetes sp.]
MVQLLVIKYTNVYILSLHIYLVIVMLLVLLVELLIGKNLLLM